jgi:hypothetical protein
VVFSFGEDGVAISLIGAKNEAECEIVSCCCFVRASSSIAVRADEGELGKGLGPDVVRPRFRDERSEGLMVDISTRPAVVRRVSNAHEHLQNPKTSPFGRQLWLLCSSVSGTLRRCDFRVLYYYYKALFEWWD